MESDLIKINRKFNLADSLSGTLLEGKTDKHGIPLIIHCRSVCNRCKDLSTEQRLSALLHECIEDGKLPHSYGTTKDEIYNIIKYLFGDQVSWIVHVLTRQKHIDYFAYIRRVYSNPLAVPVKLADIEDNLDESRGEIEQSLRDRYIKAREILLAKD